MAICKTSNEIRSIKGQFGGVYFQRGSSGQHVKAMPRTVNYTRTGEQGSHRDAWTRVSYSWKLLPKIDGGHLAPYAGSDIVEEWTVFGYTHDFIDKNGERKKLSNWQWFTHFNVPREVRDLPHYTWPPRLPKLLPMFTVRGDYWGNATVDAYESTHEINERYTYISDHIPMMIWWTGTGWTVSAHYHEPDERRDWHKEGETIKGIYDPVGPYTDYAFVNW